MLAELAVTSGAAKAAIGLMAARDFTPRFPLALVEKDFRYALEEAERVGSEAPLTRQAQDVFCRANSRGLSTENITAVTKLFE